jgi:hypothetical protein
VTQDLTEDCASRAYDSPYWGVIMIKSRTPALQVGPEGGVRSLHYFFLCGDSSRGIQDHFLAG